jgi:flagellar export protein FliJ
MPFHFSLAALLHFRQSIEHQQELRLRAANQQVARVRHLIDQLEQKAKDSGNQRAQQLSLGTTAAELQFSFLYEAGIREQMQELLREFVRRRNLRDQQQRLYQQTRRDREILENLRDRQLHEYERESRRREQREQDDLFLLRRAYLRRTVLWHG